MFRDFYTQRIKRGLVRRLNNLKIARMARLVTRHSPSPSGAPVVFFKASTGIDDLLGAAGVEWVTGRADLDPQVLLGRAHGVRGTTRTRHHGRFVFRVLAAFH